MFLGVLLRDLGPTHELPALKASLAEHAGSNPRAAGTVDAYLTRLNADS